MKNKKLKYFAWIDSFSGPMAQLWVDGGRDSQGKLKPSLKLVELPADDIRTLDELKKGYPL